MNLIDEFKEIRECDYKDEHYSVRDNGAVMRHAKCGGRLRKFDNQWTFGVKNEKTGYMTVGAARVHIIVATAFHGANDSTKLVVDHIDTNRCNNRPENLRWITRLENVLLNPVTRKKVDFLCGGIENFVKDPSCLRDVSGLYQDVSWMRTVSAEEAKRAYENVMRWAKYEKPRIKEEKPTLNDNRDKEWIFKPSRLDLSPSRFVSEEEFQQAIRQYASSNGCEMYPDENPYVQAIYPAVAVQLNWKTPTEFLCCPEEITENTLSEYASRLTKGVIFCRNDIWTSQIVEAALYDNGNGIAAITENVEGGMKLAVSKIYIKEGKIVHETEGTYFTEEGVRKYYTLLQGLEWTGGDCFEDYC